MAQPATWSISIEEIELGAGQDELFEAVRHGRLLPDGGAVIADAAGLFVRVCGPDGKREMTFGRRGGGPASSKRSSDCGSRLQATSACGMPRRRAS
jgi:hypothetical protein